jgi:type IV secretory pathway VirB6-like protein
LSENSNITWDVISNNLERPWKWNAVSKNPNITLKIIEDNPDKPWDWFYISKNQNIFKCSPTNKVIKSITKWHAANVIKRRWFKCITDPAYVICRKRLVREFEICNEI